MKQITGNKLLVKALKEEGVEYLFGYPGACTIDISDELYKQDEIKIVLPRHEQALVHEADAYARTTGKVGVCLVTSGPGATNLVTGLATANYDSVPLVCFTGQVARHLIGNDAFQEVDIVGITRSITKYGVTVRNREDLGRIIKEAFYIARTGKPGPVLIDLPKDVMAEHQRSHWSVKTCVKDAFESKTPAVPCRRRCQHRTCAGSVPRSGRENTGAGCHNRYGTRRDLHETPAVHRKPWHARRVCGEYGSQRVRSAVLDRNTFQ